MIFKRMKSVSKVNTMTVKFHNGETIEVSLPSGTAGETISRLKSKAEKFTKTHNNANRLVDLSLWNGDQRIPNDALIRDLVSQGINELTLRWSVSAH